MYHISKGIKIHALYNDEPDRNRHMRRFRVYDSPTRIKQLKCK